MVTELFSALSAELNGAQIALLEAKTRYNRAVGMLKQPAQKPFLVELALRENGTGKSDVSTQIQRIEQDLTIQRTKWGEGYPAVKLLNQTLEELRSREQEQQASVVDAYVDTLRQSYELLVQRRNELQKAYDSNSNWRRR